MNLVGHSNETPVVMDAIDLGITLLLGGNKDVQDGFAEASESGESTAFYAKLDALLIQSYDEMKAAGDSNIPIAYVAVAVAVLTVGPRWRSSRRRRKS